jgi:undecaprenyl diphosphate synthase
LTSDEIHKDQAKIRFIGRWEEQFPESLKNVLYQCLEATKDYDQYFLNFFLAYSGDDEMLNAVKTLCLSKSEVTRESLKAALMTRDMPPVDLLIRTGGEPHLSAGFMMWDMANTQLYFSDKLYPDFDEAALEGALLDYSERERRFGK